MSKKYLALLLSLLLVVSVLPLAISADETECQHTNPEWQKSNGFHSRWCPDCYETLDGWKEHAMVDNACTVCGYKLCTGEHSLSTMDAGEHKWHYCENCDYSVYCSELDEDENCKCDICDAESHVYWVRADLSTETQHCLVCWKCGVDERWEEHIYLDGVGGCVSCGYGCTHTNTCWDFDMIGHFICCEDCHQWNGEWEDHAMVDNVCTVCGYRICAGEHSIITADDLHSCANCDYYAWCGIVDEDENCKCDVCGKESHSYWEYETNETQHRGICDTCGEKGVWEHHADTDGVVGCDICGYGCEHGNINWTYYLEGHYGWCMDCSRPVQGGWGAHTIVSGECTVCGYVPCADGEHNIVAGEYMHYCDICGAYVECFDDDGDCKCDICGSEWHEVVIEQTATQHRDYCKNCDEKTDWLDHVDENKDKVCDDCEYKLSSGGDLDDVPKTGDLSVFLMAASAGLTCAAAFVSLKKRR